MSGRAFVFGDNVDTDVLAPGKYMKLTIAELARHCLESIAPEFARQVRPGDVVVGGRNFGMGSSREQAAEALKFLGIAAVIAPSFGGIFLRNALNLGLPVMVCAAAGKIRQDDRVTVDLTTGRVINETTGTTLSGEPLALAAPEQLSNGFQTVRPVDRHDLGCKRIRAVSLNDARHIRAKFLQNFPICRRPRRITEGVVDADTMILTTTQLAERFSFEPFRKPRVAHRSPRDPAGKIEHVALRRLIEGFEPDFAVNHLARKHQRQAPAHRMARGDR